MIARRWAVYGMLIATSGGLLAIPLLTDPPLDMGRSTVRANAPRVAEPMADPARRAAVAPGTTAESTTELDDDGAADIIAAHEVDRDQGNSPTNRAALSPAGDATDDPAERAPENIDGRQGRVPAGAAAEAAPNWLTVTVQRGDTLAHILADAGISRSDAYSIVGSLAGVFNPRDLRPGHEIRIGFVADPSADADAYPMGRLHGIELTPAIDRAVAVLATEDSGFVASATAKPVSRMLARSKGEIAGGSLMAAGMSAGVPASVMTDMIRLFSFDVDFQRDIQPGDGFDLLYERFQLADGRLVRGGEVIYAALSVDGKPLRLYRYKDARGGVDYYNEKGHSVRKALLRTPIDGARLSSRFGMREHPIMGFTVMHRGVDFAAPTGTPIFAAGEGAIETIGDHAGYGRYVRLRHSGSYATAYAHLSAYGRGLKKGMRVRQGQVIGYVGTSGRSTGPHLHYEVIRDGKQVNPISVKFPSGEKLTGVELARFEANRAAVDRAVASPQNTDQLAASSGR